MLYSNSIYQIDSRGKSPAVSRVSMKHGDWFSSLASKHSFAASWPWTHTGKAMPGISTDTWRQLFGDHLKHHLHMIHIAPYRLYRGNPKP